MAGSGSVHCESWRDRLGWVREGSKLGFAEFEWGVLYTAHESVDQRRVRYGNSSNPAPALRDAGFEVPPGVDVKVVRH